MINRLAILDWDKHEKKSHKTRWHTYTMSVQNVCKMKGALIVHKGQYG